MDPDPAEISDPCLSESVSAKMYYADFAYFYVHGAVSIQF